jgi:hypothetical protein
VLEVVHIRKFGFRDPLPKGGGFQIELPFFRAVYSISDQPCGKNAKLFALTPHFWIPSHVTTPTTAQDCLL